jgi:Cu(I)/Ag(I) efflux system membrane fusion protein
MYKNKNVILLLVIAVFVIGIGWFSSRERRSFTRQVQGKTQVWYCPMHPWIKSDKPGVCPICGMALVPGHEHHQEVTTPSTGIPGYVAIDISLQKQELAGIRIALVSKKTVIKTIRAAGQVAYDPDLYKEEVRYVEDYIAYLRLDRRLNQGSYTIQDAQRKLKEEELDLYHMGATDQTITQLQQNKFPDHSLLVAHGDEVQVFAQIFEDDLGFVDVGQKAIVEVPAYHETLEGTVRNIDPIIDPVSRTARAHIWLEGNNLKSNMFVNVSMPVELNDSIVIPREAVMDTGLRKIVFVKDGDTFQPRVIQTGWETDNGFEVTSGLKEGERIAVSGNFLLDSESRVQASLQEDSNHG